MAKAKAKENQEVQDVKAKSNVNPKIEQIKKLLEGNNHQLLIRLGGVQIVVSEFVEQIGDSVVVFKNHRNSSNPIYVDVNHVAYFFLM